MRNANFELRISNCEFRIANFTTGYSASDESTNSIGPINLQCPLPNAQCDNFEIRNSKFAFPFGMVESLVDARERPQEGIARECHHEP